MSGSNAPPPRNEPVRHYEPGSEERGRLRDELTTMQSSSRPLPMHVNGRELHGQGETFSVTLPHRHASALGYAWHASGDDVGAAIDAALAAANDWAAAPWESRAAVFLRAAELAAGPWRARLNAATMLGQSKSVFQAEIDAACELIDFWRWNVHFSERIRNEQPVSADGVWNRLDVRPLEGFILAITPFNFTSIAGNLPTAPALMGNVVVWKPAQAQQLAATVTMELLEAAGLPPGVINMVTGEGGAVSHAALSHPGLAGVHFTGSTNTFQHLWRTVAANIDNYRTYPRLVGETGGKNFVVAHESASPDALTVALLRGAFEYQGQKCSAVSRAYVPEHVWRQIEAPLAGAVESIRVGDPADFRTFMGAVIDARAYQRLDGVIRSARDDSHLRLVTGGEGNDIEGWFIQPTIYATDDPTHSIMERELFGPILTVYAYPASMRWDDVLRLVDRTSPYGLTGAIFATDQDAVDAGLVALRNAAGNAYINDKPTGAVVGQQPFGGSRASGTNDKAGSIINLWRWVSPRAIKETFTPPRDWRYPHMDAD